MLAAAYTGQPSTRASEQRASHQTAEAGLPTAAEGGVAAEAAGPAAAAAAGARPLRKPTAAT